MKYIKILLVGACLAFMGCDNEENQWVMNEIFKSELSDTTLTAESHELYIKISRRETSTGLPTTWNHYAITGVWDESLPGTDKWLLNAGDKSWITLQKVQKEGFDYLNVKVKSNSDEQPRAVRIMVWATKDGNDNYEFTSNEIYIWQKGKEEKEGPFEVKVRYKGQLHSSMATLDENEHIVYEDADFAAFMEKLAQRGGIEAIARENGIIDYYDSDDVEAVAAIRRMMEPINAFSAIEPRWCSFATRSDANPYRYMNANALAYCALFDDKGYKDTHIHQNFMNLTDYYDQERMKNVGLNDKVTSLAVAYNGNDSTICAVLTVWEDTDYNHGDNNRTKHRMSFVASYNNPTMGWRNLKYVPCLTGGDSWNDRISSISFHFGHYGSYLKDY